MSEKNRQSKLPVVLAIGLLLCTLIAAYIYQKNKSSVAVVSTSSELIAVSKTVKEDAEQQSSGQDNSEKSVETEKSKTEKSEQVPDSVVPILENQRIDPTGLVVLGGRSEAYATIKIFLNSFNY